MTSPVWCELVCSQCAATMAGRFTCDRIPRVEMRSEAKRAGWLLVACEWYCSKDCLRRAIECKPVDNAA